VSVRGWHPALFIARDAKHGRACGPLLGVAGTQLVDPERLEVAPAGPRVRRAPRRPRDRTPPTLGGTWLPAAAPRPQSARLAHPCGRRAGAGIRRRRHAALGFSDLTVLRLIHELPDDP
jgi:hypothetical protein